MVLCLDVGNTHIFGGVYQHDKWQVQFRYPSFSPCTSDQLGVFFKNVIRENDLSPQDITEVVICSVVPSMNYSIRSAFLKYFSIEPLFLKIDNVTDLTFEYSNPAEIGTDRISNAIAAVNLFPGKNIIVIDLGTATTFDAITNKKAYLGGIIMPGINIGMKSLYENTAKLPPVNIVKPDYILGQTTISNIQSGLYYSTLGAAREILTRIQSEIFQNQPTTIIGTGGFAYLFESEKIFDMLMPELVLEGLRLTIKY